MKLPKLLRKNPIVNRNDLWVILYSLSFLHRSGINVCILSPKCELCEMKREEFQYSVVVQVKNKMV